MILLWLLLCCAVFVGCMIALGPTGIAAFVLMVLFWRVIFPKEN